MPYCLAYEIVSAFNRKAAREKWRELEEIPVCTDKDGNAVLFAAWEMFPEGTPVKEIWQWFEDTYHISVADDLMKR
jgi:hypothetical protein